MDRGYAAAESSRQNWRSPPNRTPAVVAGLADHPYDIDWLVGLVEARDLKPGKRGPYRKRQKEMPPAQPV